MSYFYQSYQLGSIASFKNYFISSPLLRENTRYFSYFFRLLDDNPCSINSIDIKPIVKYDNADIDRVKILKENKKKSGIYLWTNLINGNSYVGSSVNIYNRLLQYYSTKHLLSHANMVICRALLKQGYSNFSLSILEYCEPDKCLEREGYYLKLLNTEYNCSTNPTASFSGLKHSDESRKKMSEAQAGEKHRLFGKKHSEETLVKFRARRHSEETKIRMKEARLGRKHSEETKIKMREAKIKMRDAGEGRPGQKIEVLRLDKDENQTTTYDSIREAAKALNINRTVISKYFYRCQTKPYKGRYIFINLYQK
jgi:group I intron endonuclease